MIALSNHSVSYGGIEALKAVNLSIKQKEKVAILGPSGAGKSTLLRELYSAATGRASLVHQQFALVPQLKVFHNVYMGKLDVHPPGKNLMNLILPNKVEKEIIREVLLGLGIDSLINRRVSKLSGGEQQRVALARALYSGSDLILGDEPVSAIDPSNSERVMSLLNNLDETVVLSMHDVDLAVKFLPRIIGLRHGEVVFDLPTAEVSDSHLYSLYSTC